MVIEWFLLIKKMKKLTANCKKLFSYFKFFKELLLIIISFILIQSINGQTLMGKVSDNRSGNSLSNVKIIIQGNGEVIETATDESGFYLIDIHSGTYMMSCHTSGYSSEKKANIDVSSGEVKIINFNIDPGVSDKPIITGNNAKGDNSSNNYNTQSYEEQKSLYASSSSIGEDLNEVESLMNSDYDRSSLTYLYLSDAGDDYLDNIIFASNHANVSGRFNDNNLSIRSVNSTSLPYNEDKNDAILSYLENERFANKIISKWFSRNEETGSLSMDVIKARGLYDATDAEMIEALSSKRGIARLMDAGDKLIDKSYILVLDFTEVITMKEYYNRNDISAVLRTRNGYVAYVTGYVYKIDFDAIKEKLYNELWIYDSDDEYTKQRKIKEFENLYIPISFEVSGSAEAESSQGNRIAKDKKKTEQELFNELYEISAREVIYNIGIKYEHFRVKTPIYDVKPIIAKVGKKEGLKKGRRFFVWSNEGKTIEDIKSVRKGVVRVRKVADNEYVATGDSEYSKFRQVAGKRLEKGMTLEQRNDLGFIFGVSFLLNLNEVQAYGFGIGYEASRILRFLPTGFKIYAEFAFLNIKDLDGTQTKSEYGLAFPIYFARNFRLEPMLGYGSFKDGEYSEWIFNGGLRFGVNILHNFQFILTGKYYQKFGLSDMLNIDTSYDDINGITFGAGLQYEF